MLKDICHKIDFPEEAASLFQTCFDTVSKTEGAYPLLCAARDSYVGPDAYDSSYMDRVEALTGIHRYTLDMVLLLFCAGPMHLLYEQRGLPEDIYWASLKDLTYKLTECKTVHNIWGTWDLPWFRGFYLGQRFSIGRLQYEYNSFDAEVYKGILKSGDPAIFCHIPSCGPLLREDVLESLRLAREFFKKDFPDGPIPFVCRSWLLNPAHYEVFPEGSNLRQFYELWDIIWVKKQSHNGDFWRVFGQHYDPQHWQEAPCQTSLQKRFMAYLKEGNSMDHGYGVIL